MRQKSFWSSADCVRAKFANQNVKLLLTTRRRKRQTAGALRTRGFLHNVVANKEPGNNGFANSQQQAQVDHVLIVGRYLEFYSPGVSARATKFAKPNIYCRVEKWPLEVSTIAHFRVQTTSQSTP